jgi:hypothetical protein
MGTDIEKHQCEICQGKSLVEIRVLGETCVCVSGCKIFPRGGNVEFNNKGEVSVCGVNNMEIRKAAKLATDKAYYAQ